MSVQPTQNDPPGWRDIGLLASAAAGLLALVKITYASGGDAQTALFLVQNTDLLSLALASALALPPFLVVLGGPLLWAPARTALGSASGQALVWGGLLLFVALLVLLASAPWIIGLGAVVWVVTGFVRRRPELFGARAVRFTARGLGGILLTVVMLGVIRDAVWLPTERVCLRGDGARLVNVLRTDDLAVTLLDQTGRHVRVVAHDAITARATCDPRRRLAGSVWTVPLYERFAALMGDRRTPDTPACAGLDAPCPPGARS